MQFLCNLACTVAFADQTEYFQFAIGESGEARIHICRSTADVLMKQLVCHAVAEVDVST